MWDTDPLLPLLEPFRVPNSNEINSKKSEEIEYTLSDLSHLKKNIEEYENELQQSNTHFNDAKEVIAMKLKKLLGNHWEFNYDAEYCNCVDFKDDYIECNIRSCSYDLLKNIREKCNLKDVIVSYDKFKKENALSLRIYYTDIKED